MGDVAGLSGALPTVLGEVVDVALGQTELGGCGRAGVVLSLCSESSGAADQTGPRCLCSIHGPFSQTERRAKLILGPHATEKLLQAREQLEI